MSVSLPYRETAVQIQNQILQPPKQLNEELPNLKSNYWDEGSIEIYIRRKDVFRYTFFLPTTKAKLYLWTHTEVGDIPSQVERFLLWLGTPENFHVYLYFQDLPRNIAKDEWPSRRTVNGGWTTQNTNTIHIFRSEEWERVLIHEVIHAMNWDWNMGSEPKPCWKIKGILAPHLFEAWTELFAEWLYCSWFNIPWEAQRNYQENQAIQILARAPPVWNEDTSIFAYYILKTALAPHIIFLLSVQLGKTEEEREFILCNLLGGELNRLRQMARNISVYPISLRMTIPKK